MIELTKPAIDYTSEERAEIYADLVRQNRRRYAVNGRLTAAEALRHEEFVITKLYRSA